MGREELIHILESQAERLLDLAKRLSDHGGRPLTTEEAQTIRTAIYPRLNEEMTYIRMMFLDGRDIHPQDFERVTRCFEF